MANDVYGAYVATSTTGEVYLGYTELRLTDAFGKVVHLETGPANNNRHPVELDLAHLPAGLYLLQVQQGRLLVHKRIVV